MSNSDDDIPALSAETFMALQEFYKEQEIKESKLKLAVASSDIKDIHIEEDWVNIINSVIYFNTEHC